LIDIEKNKSAQPAAWLNVTLQWVRTEQRTQSKEQWLLHFGYRHESADMVLFAYLKQAKKNQQRKALLVFVGTERGGVRRESAAPIA
jgi:hypothetical protein